MDKNLLKKIDKVHNILKNKKVLVAFSGGVDSSLIASLAKDVSDRVLAVTVSSQLLTDDELKNAENIANELNVEWKKTDMDILTNEKLIENPPDRCYYCKREILKKLSIILKDENLDFIVDGTNAEDLKGYRPGNLAIVEFKVKSPLAEAEIKKNEVREIAKFRELSAWQLPSLACLASRIPYGEKITVERLKMIENAEKFIKMKAHVRVARVRFHDNLARIEVGKKEMKKLFSDEIITAITSHLKGLGFKYIALDLEGYRTGSMDEIL